MNARLEAGCALLGALLVVTGANRARAFAGGPPNESNVAIRGRVRAPAPVATDSLDEAAATIVANDPFRLSNTPASVRYGSFVGATPPPSVVSRPQFILRAIVGGPPWSAIIDGVPGQDGGVVVSAGLALGSVRIRSISRDTVVLQSTDTTWKLTMKASP